MFPLPRNTFGKLTREQDVFCKRPSAQAVYRLLQVIILLASVITGSDINTTAKIKISGNTQKKRQKAIIPSNSVLNSSTQISFTYITSFMRLFILITTWFPIHEKNYTFYLLFSSGYSLNLSLANKAFQMNSISTITCSKTSIALIYRNMTL